ncbi:RagB/SusD family nutrient uptake outer membrane protein [Chryseobacterium taklimakanense]|uniref:RagB/SusD family nutrient uptake outer membrane protein n=1 Tax=Chryseobacterium taklimakanense TaxID=536441 RepID=UPI000F603084|nr:RagB/SusD family nutrient uptake outer membrane protein [Chryseobacterium taklimakanense]AZI22820.1 RagB/SusD family nutrient uptake outer membrane protein [Chryseobacterium taklimakanense]
MKTIFRNNIIKYSLGILLAGTFNSCRDEFTNRPSEDSISAESYYKTNDQVRSSTDALYYKTWFQFNNKFFYALTEVGSGNMYTNSSDVNAMRTFSITPADPEMYAGWQSLWANVAQANYLINNLQTRVDPSVSQTVVNNALGEAHFMRATAYFYLVRIWGNVPIIEDNLKHVADPQINTNPVTDVYELIRRDYMKAVELLDSKMRSSAYAANAKVSKGSAKAMLAKVYLYNKDYVKARQLAEEVINSGEFKLLGGTSVYSVSGKTFGDLFKYPNNNNEESIFALQWKADAQYGSANNTNTQFGISNGTISTSNTSYGGVFGPSQDILKLYGTNDVRRNATIMFPGNTYPDMKVKNGSTFQMGLTVPSADQIGGQGSGAAIKKYCIGIVNGNETGPVDGWGMMNNNTYIMRYAELLLIHAEAVMAGGASTSDPAALTSLNAVRNRAGLSPLSTVTFNELFAERRKELAFEGDYWFDLGRLPRTQAISIISAQNRGNMWGAEYYTPSEKDFTLPYPANDVAKNPKLLEAPVPYQFN